MHQDLTQQQRKDIAQHLEEAIEKAIEKDSFCSEALKTSPLSSYLLPVPVKVSCSLSECWQELLGYDIVHLLFQVRALSRDCGRFVVSAAADPNWKPQPEKPWSLQPMCLICLIYLIRP